MFRKQHTLYMYEPSIEPQFPVPFPEVEAASRPEEGGKSNPLMSLTWHRISQLINTKIFIPLILIATMNSINIEKEWSMIKTLE